MRRRRLDRRRNTRRTHRARRRRWSTASASGPADRSNRAQQSAAAWGVGGPGLMVGVDGEGTTWAAVDINDEVRERGLLRARDDDDRQLEPACAGVIVTPRDADRAAAQARTDLRRDTGQIASCLV